MWVGLPQVSARFSAALGPLSGHPCLRNSTPIGRAPNQIASEADAGFTQLANKSQILLDIVQ
jgi:hypothetical protein